MGIRAKFAAGLILILVVNLGVGLYGLHLHKQASLREAQVRERSSQIVASAFQEYEAVAHRRQITDLCPLNTTEIHELLNAFYSVCHWIPIYYLWRPNLKDEADNFLLELALAGNASHIITNNVRDLHGAELNFLEFSVATPEQILRGT